ncbi:MAG: RES family NAD+ phosphorylase [Prosthecobacter sp.]|nr:RES family NAD+ phosphorylase [Prosthecobacter sp.]
MPYAWRIVKAKYAATAFTGEGASRTGGRWNSRGVWMVYTSASKSLAALETLVHLNPPVLFNYVTIRLEFDDALVEKVPQADLPKGWTEQPAPPSTKEIGDAWVKERRSAVLQIASVIVPDESNYLLNSAHADFRKIVIGKPEPFAFDPRLL